MNSCTASPTVSDDKREALHALLSACGHDADDFEIEEDTDSCLLFGLTGGVLVLRRRSSGEERLYATGAGSAWFAAVMMDVSRGLLGRPAPSATPAHS